MILDYRSIGFDDYHRVPRICTRCLRMIIGVQRGECRNNEANNFSKDRLLYTVWKELSTSLLQLKWFHANWNVLYFNVLCIYIYIQRERMRICWILNPWSPFSFSHFISAFLPPSSIILYRIEMISITNNPSSTWANFISLLRKFKKSNIWFVTRKF